jgi:hypothetical protein
MELEINFLQSPAQARLLDPDELRSFAVAVIDTHVRDEAEWPDAVARHEEHVWVRIDALRALAEPQVDAGWEAGFEQVLAYARSRGWVDDELQAVRGHVERRTSPRGG